MANPLFSLAQDLLDLAGARWTITVMTALNEKSRIRFNEIAHAVGGISQKQLAVTLRSLQRHGFVTRFAFATIPPRVEYELTDLGRDFGRSFAPLGAFVSENQRSIEAARREFDSAA